MSDVTDSFKSRAKKLYTSRQSRSLQMLMLVEGQSSGLRRSKMEVKIDIMQAIAEGAGRPTHIMYRSNLSWAVMRSFIKALESQGLILSSQIDGKKSYVLTEKGTRVLKTYASVRNQLESLAPLISTAEPIQA